MEANGLSKSRLPHICLGCGCCAGGASQKVGEEVLFMNAVQAASKAVSSPRRVGGRCSMDMSSMHTAVTMDMSMHTLAALDTSMHIITPSSSRQNSLNLSSFHQEDEIQSRSSFVSLPNCHVARFCDQECLRKRCAGKDESSTVLKGVYVNVAMAQARIRDVEDRILNCSVRSGNAGSPMALQNQLYTEKVRLIDALVIMAWEHYRWFLSELQSSFEKAEAAVRHIYEEALDVSIQLFCSTPPNSSIAAMNNERLMILLLLLDFDEYCETLLDYQLSREYMGKHPLGENHGADSAAGVGRGEATHRRMGEMLDGPSMKGANYLQQLHELWKSGQFDRFDPTIATEEEDNIGKIHAAGLCLVLFRKLESQHADHRQQQMSDLDTMQKRFRYLFDDYLPRQLTRPSMNNIIATKYARILFQDGTPTVYWSLLADSYRKEWGEYFDRDSTHTTSYEEEDEEDSTEMDTDDDENDGFESV